MDFEYILLFYLLFAFKIGARDVHLLQIIDIYISRNQYLF